MSPAERPAPRPEGFPKRLRLRKRPQFTRVQRSGRRHVSRDLVLVAGVRDDMPRTGDDGPRVGFTVSKKVGNAVIRNRVKRRLREAARRQLAALGPHDQLPALDVVWIARASAASASFTELVGQLEDGLGWAVRSARRGKLPRLAGGRC